MSNETTSTSAASTVQTWVERQLVPETRENNLLASFLYWTVPEGPGATVSVPRMAVTPEATSISTGPVEAAAQPITQLTTDSIALTAAVKAVHFLISKFLQSTSMINWQTQTPVTAGRTLAAKLETDIGVLLAGFSGSSGTGGSALTVATLDAAITAYGISALEESEKAVIVLHRQQVGDLRSELSGGQGAGLAQIFSRSDSNIADLFGQTGRSALANFLGFFYNIPVFQTTFVSKINSDADFAGAIIARSPGMTDVTAALAGYLLWPPQVRQFDQGSNQIIGDSWQGFEAYGVSELKDNLGQRIVSAV